MPTYQYACTACDERLEAVQSFSDAPLTECPACGGALRKVFSAVGVVFKGSGFYKTDSRAKSSGAGKDSGSSGDSAGSGGDAKPAAASSDGGASKPAATPAASTSTPAASKTA